MPEITLPQGTIHYADEGNPAGPPVVFVHGFAVNGDLWKTTGKGLGERARVLRPTLPLGSHTIPMNADADLSPRGVARIVIGFLEALDLNGVTLVGNDTGGAICQFVLDEDASRIGRLVLTNCDAFDNFPPAPFSWFVKPAALPGALLAILGPTRIPLVRHVLGYGPLVRNRVDDDLSWSWVAPILTDRAIRRDTRKLLKRVDAAELLDVSTRLHRFDRPVLLTWAPADKYFRIEFARRLEAVFPDARLVEIHDAKTFVPHDQPQRLADLIADFAAGGQAAAVAAGSQSAG